MNFFRVTALCRTSPLDSDLPREFVWQHRKLFQQRQTLSYVPHIVANGADWLRSFGTEQSPGTKVVSVSGDVKRPGNYEVELGVPTRGLIYDLAGGRSTAARPRASSPAVPPRPCSSGRGARPALQLRGDGRGGVDARLGLDHRLRRQHQHRRAGAADGALLPPRVLRQVLALPGGDQLDGEDARADDPRRGDADRPRDHHLGADDIIGNCLCVLGDSMAMPVGSMVQKFRDEFMEAIQGGLPEALAA